MKSYDNNLFSEMDEQSYVFTLGSINPLMIEDCRPVGLNRVRRGVYYAKNEEGIQDRTTEKRRVRTQSGRSRNT